MSAGADVRVEYRGRWQDGEPGWRRYRKVQGPGYANKPEGDTYPVLTFTCAWCADLRMHTQAEHDLLVSKHSGRYVREDTGGNARPKRRPRRPPDKKGTRR